MQANSSLLLKGTLISQLFEILGSVHKGDLPWRRVDLADETLKLPNVRFHMHYLVGGIGDFPNKRSELLPSTSFNSRTNALIAIGFPDPMLKTPWASELIAI